MQYRNIKRGLIMRHGVANYNKKHGTKLRTVHVNVLYTIYIHTCARVTFSASKVCLFLCKIHRGSDQNYINTVLKELLEEDMIALQAIGRLKRYTITLKGKIVLHGVEKTLTNTRIDRFI